MTHLAKGIQGYLTLSDLRYKKTSCFRCQVFWSLDIPAILTQRVDFKPFKLFLLVQTYLKTINSFLQSHHVLISSTNLCLF